MMGAKWQAVACLLKCTLPEEGMAPPSHCQPLNGYPVYGGPERREGFRIKIGLGRGEWKEVSKGYCHGMLFPAEQQHILANK